jgi:hypothetical protein
MELSVPVAVYYQVEYIPKGCRRPVTSLFRADPYAVIRQVGRDEVDVAFRVPEQGRYTKKWKIFEIISYDGRLYWPLRWSHGEAGRDWHVTADQCLLEIKVGYEDLLFQRRGSKQFWYKIEKIESVSIRQILSNDYERAYTAACSKMGVYVLLCGGMAYVAGREPVYYHTGWSCSIARLGPDRYFNEWLDSNQYDSYNVVHTKEALRDGNFQLADGYDAVKATFSKEEIEELRPIEVLKAAFIQTPHAEIQLDALFWHLFEYFRRESEFFLPEVRLSLSELAEKGPSVSSTSLDRLRALKRFLAAVEAQSWYDRPLKPYEKALYDDHLNLHKKIARFIQTESVTSASGDAEMTKEDYEAIGNMAT